MFLSLGGQHISRLSPWSAKRSDSEIRLIADLRDSKHLQHAPRRASTMHGSAGVGLLEGRLPAIISRGCWEMLVQRSLAGMLHRYFSFDGRISRKEFLYGLLEVFLFGLICCLPLTIILPG